MKHSLKTKLSFSTAIVVLLTVAIISLLANVFIDKQFNSYINRQQEQKIQGIVSNISGQYQESTDTWNTEYIHAIGMYALYEGYIVKAIDARNQPIWDAQAHDMSLCSQTMSDISTRMTTQYPQMKGEVTTKTYNLTRNDKIIGTVNISYYGPYFFSENDFQFMDSLNIILIAVAIFSLFISVIIGILMARHLSSPILDTVIATKKIADGNYEVRLQESSNTKEMDMLVLSVNHLAESLENTEKLRKQLTQDVSHELRTPIAILQSHLEAMIEGVWQPTTQRLQSCDEEVKRIGDLVSELEKLARTDHDVLNLNKTETNLLELVNKALKRFEVNFKDKNLQVNVKGDCSSISADEEKISQVIVNLLSNAVKYTEDGDSIDINVSETNDSVIMNIKDNGLGIPDNELPYIFERFYRADKSRNRKTGGIGLGLAIVKSIVEAHGGKVSAVSKLGQGSSFEVVLPKHEDLGLKMIKK